MSSTNGTGQSPTGTPYLPPSWVRPLMAIYVALAGLAGYLALFSGNAMAEKVGAILGGVLAVLGPLLGIASPGMRKLAGLFLALGLTFTTTSAVASTSTILNPRPTLAGVPSVGDILDLVPGVGVTCRAGSCALAPHLWGSVALVDVAPGWTLGPVLGGAAILEDTGISGAVSLGAGLQLPWGSSVRMGLLVTADYYHPAELMRPGWGVSGSLGFFF